MASKIYPQITVTRNSTKGFINAPDFTEKEFHGRKSDNRNEIANTHTISENLVIAAQAIRNWTRQVYGGDGVPMVITSTRRTPKFNAMLGGSSGKKAAHVMGIAVDWSFSGPKKIDATAKFNTDIRDKGPLYQTLRSIGINAFGLYGPGSRYGVDFCHMDLRDSTTSNLPRSHSDAKNGAYAKWTEGTPRYTDKPVSVPTQDTGSVKPIPNGCVDEQVFTFGISTGRVLFVSDLLSNDDCNIDPSKTELDILNYKHNGTENRKRLHRALKPADKITYTGNGLGIYDESKNYPIEVGAIMYVPCEWVISSKQKQSTIQPSDPGTRVGGSTGAVGSSTGVSESKSAVVNDVKIGSNIQESHKIEAIPYPPIFSAITQDPGFRKMEDDESDPYKNLYPRITVYGWSRALFKAGANPIVNLTCDVIGCSTQHDLSSGGAFSLELSPVTAKLVGDVWTKRSIISSDDSEFCVNLASVTRNSRQGQGNETFSGDFVGWRKDDSLDIKRTSLFYYDMVLQQNDLIFIKYEQLAIDGPKEKEPRLADHWYDMMALVDSVDVSINSQGTVVSINVEGRDYQKALMDESGYYNPYSIGGTASMFGEYADIISPRSFDGGIFQYRTVEYLTLSKSLEFALYALISNQFVPSAAFRDNWSNKDLSHIALHWEGHDPVTKDFDVMTDRTVTQGTADDRDRRNEDVKAFGLRGIWQKVRFWIDPKIADYVVYDDSISTPEGSIWDHFQKLCQNPYVEVFTETIGDWFYIIVRQPPFTRAILREITEVSGRHVSDPFTEDEENKYRVWKDAFNYLDASTIYEEDHGNDVLARGVIGNYDHIKQYEDFFANGYPNKSGSLRSLSFEDQLRELGYIQETRDGINSSTQRFPRVVNIKLEDVASFTLSFSKEAYTWFEVDTRGMYQSTGGPYGMPIPAVYFDKLAQIYGSKRMSVSSNYIDIHSLRDGGKDPEKKRNLLEKEIAQLLGYLIETHIYLPFTREGSITITNGDRRIKKGTFIYFQPTNELLYVTGVSNQLKHTNTGIHRVTQISVNRGMVLDYVQGKTEVVFNDDGTWEERKVSYFDIVDLPRLKETALDAVNELGDMSAYDHKKPAPINEGVLNFFLQKKQFKRT